MAIGLFIVLSVAVFGSILYTCFSCVDTEIVSVDTNAGYVNEAVRAREYRNIQADSDLALKEMPSTADPGYWKGIDRGFALLLPD